MAAGKKKKAEQSPKQQHRLSLDSVVPLKRCIRAPKHHHHRSENKKISPDLSSKIMKEALKQQKEILDEENREDHSNGSFPYFSDPPVQQDNGVNEDDVDAFDGFSDTLSQYDGGELEIDEEDAKVLATFMAKETGPELTLADIILQRMKEKDAEVAADARSRPKLDDKTINIFKGYKNELQSKDKDNLLRLMQHQKHYLVTPEIKRELKSSRNRGEKEIYVMSTSSMPLVNKPIEEDRWDVPEVPMEED